MNIRAVTLVLIFHGAVFFTLARVSADDSAINAVGDRINREFVQQLRATLKGRETVSSLSACIDAALIVAGKNSREGKQSVDRVTIDRARKDANPAELPVLDEYQADVSAKGKGRPTRVRNAILGPGKDRWYVPIVLHDPVCLSCHGVVGREVSPAVTSALAAKFPGYTLHGKKLGDLLGLWRVTIRTIR